MSMQMTFPAVRGRMGNRKYYVAMFPLRVVPRLFMFIDWAQMPPEVRAQRKLNEKRVPEITRYILDHEEDWLFSSLTASFTADEEFESSSVGQDIGMLRIPLDAEFLINDGQHRKAAIEEALRVNPTLGDQTISVVLFPSEDLERNQQMFSDLNRTVQKTSRSLDILYDHRDPMNRVTLAVVGAVPLFKGRVEKDSVSLAVRSPKFATLSALYDANSQLLGKIDANDEDALADAEDRATEYWEAVTENVPQWRQIRDSELKPAEARAEYISTHAVASWALGAAGRELLRQYPDEVNWKARLEHLSGMDWSKANPEWQGICMLGGDIITRRQTKEALAKYIQWKLELIGNKPVSVLDVPSTAS